MKNTVLIGIAVVALMTRVGFADTIVERDLMVAVEDTTLEGTLLLPAAEGPYPAVLIVAATGPHPRDEARTGGTHWRDLAIALAETGVASLRMDARSAHTSPRVDGAPDDPDDYQWTPDQLAADAGAALTVLQTQPEIDRGRIGIVAFSDGTSRAAMIASQRPDDVAFCVLLSGSGVAPMENVVAQQVNHARSIGLDEHAVAVVENRGRTARTMIVENADAGETLSAINELLVALGLPEEQRDAMAPQLLENFSNDGARALLRHDPAPYLDAMECPTLAVNGGADTRLMSPLSRQAMLDALEMDTTTKLQTMMIGGLGHFLEPVGADENPRTFDSSVVRTVTAWIELILSDETSNPSAEPHGQTQ